MIKLCELAIGFYLVIDAIYLASQTDREDRWCQIAKYAGALMSGGYLILAPANDVILILGATVALFMWAETWYRFINYAEINCGWLYLKYVRRFGHPQRRRLNK